MQKNGIAKRENTATFSMKMSSDKFQNKIHEVLQDKNRAIKFTAALTSAVANQPALQECEATTILSSALLGESLNLSPSPQLGQYYIVPYKDRKNGRTVGTFQLGYKGYVQLALRSGNYKKLNVLEVKEGELISWNPLTEEIKINLIEDEVDRELRPTVGYYVSFEYLNGFSKAMYWTKDKMISHAKKYSKAYASDTKNGTSYSFWTSNFDEMAKKTMLRQIISKWGIMSTEMNEAFTSDNAVIGEGQIPEYIDNQEQRIDKVVEAVEVETPIERDEPVIDVAVEGDDEQATFKL
jgi:recombination protein RecT|nr:MAG TPA: RecT protein [Caudoviricetes sp.]